MVEGDDRVFPADASDWFRRTPLVPGSRCSYNSRCEECRSNGDCDPCLTIDGRSVSAVCEYASTCDRCGNLTMHEAMRMDRLTQLGYCARCVPKLPLEITSRFYEKGEAIGS